MMNNVLCLDEKTICDLECILEGYFNPLYTFMDEDDWKSVCDKMELKNGEFFPLPVVLAVEKNKYTVGDIVKLCDSTNYPLAELQIKSMFEPDINYECQKCYGTTDLNHPYVNYKFSNHHNKVYISGTLEQINSIRHYDFKQERITPLQMKEHINKYNWKTVVGFQTRNPMHRAHYELTKYALNKSGDKNAKLFLNPVVGETQSVDIDYHTRVMCYKQLLNKYEENQVKLGLLPLAMRMAGPREACLHALIRRNYGCTHFVVGRDHAGPSFKKQNGESFYGPYEAQELLIQNSSKIGIIPIISKLIVFNETKNIYQPIDEVQNGDKVLQLSGTEVRRCLLNNEDIPEWFSYPDVVKILRNSQRTKGTCYYCIGLSGSGKTTYANQLRIKLLEKNPGEVITILDGDVVRQNLSKGLGFSKEDRSMNVRRIGYVASEIVKHGGTVICANIAPYDEDRKYNKKMIESVGGKYIQIWVKTSLDVCEQRDVKGLYKLAREGKIKQFTGISDPFEDASDSDIIIETEDYEFIV